ncbi:hypothetical protein FSP39_008726 [Pinctada imbricata]|uniref:3-beta hydroxysteroid dehydrogenase/isomerase domain-containing protein n=1 Tax=Pinctada imbricata TaxID=66713 RepID=A0AA89BT42_PINIB|nr:hypothetical protein FSP39_008726 [Pinctada imbricata]
MTCETHLVTGGGGYPGYHLGKKLAELGKSVILLDIRPPSWQMVEGMKFIQCNITRYDEVEEAFRGVDCVYHLASYGMSGREQLNKKLIEAVNIGGTKNVIDACIKHRISRLVYTSTYNVVFGGQEIMDGEESLPYLPLDKHPDHYSRTKSIAEQLVMEANGREGLHTCALRLAGVYGPGEQRHIPRTMSMVEAGFLLMLYGEGSLQDFLHVDNLVQGHILAMQALSPANHSVAAGQTYFLSDGAPINTFLFFKPLFEGLGYKLPKLQIPLSVVYFIAYLTEWIHYIVGRIYNFQPMLTRTEVYKTGVTHYFSIRKAQRDLGYEPTVQNDLTLVLKEYIAAGHGRKRRKGSSFVYYLVNVIIGLIFASFILSYLPGVK